MEGTAGDVVVDNPSSPRAIPVPRENQNKEKGSNHQFQQAVAMPDLLDPQPTNDPTSEPNSDPSSDNTSPSSFLGTPYSTSLQFDYPFPVSNAPRSDARTPPLPSALPIASSLGSAPSMVAAATSTSPDSPPSSKDKSEPSSAMALPSLVSTIAANPDIPVNANLSELRSLANKSTTSLASTHSGSGHGHGVMIPQSSSNPSGLSISPPSSYQSIGPSSKTTSPPPTQTSFSRRKGRHSLSISPVPPPSLSFNTGGQKPAASTGLLRRQNTNDSTMTNGTEASETSRRMSSGSVSSLSISNLQLLNLTGPSEPPIPPSLLTKLPTFNTRTSQSSINSATSSYFTSKLHARPTHHRTDSSSTTGSTDMRSSVTSPPFLHSQASTADTLTSSPSNKSGSTFSLRPSLGRSNTTGGPNIIATVRPLFTRNHTSTSVQSRAYAQHLHDQQQQQMKLTEESKKKEEKEKKRLSLRRPSLSLRRSRSGSSSSSSARSSSKSKPSSIKSKSPSSSTSTSSVALSGQERGSDDAVTESEGSISPPIKGTKLRRRSSVRRALEKTGSLIGFNLNPNAVKRNGTETGA